MRNLILILFIFSPLLLISQNNTKMELSSLIDQWHQAAAVADETTYFNFLANQGVFIGTDSSENWTKEEFQTWAKPYFDRGKAWTLKANSRNVYLHRGNEMAWFDELLFTKSGPWRGSGVLVKENGNWKIMHYVLSLTIPNEKMKAVNALLMDQ
ncbi:MAG: nuclear transport factor 2 family protein [Bacteroidetes bacterium]|nr:nuclear transport factor 2 family protein [Bacteroidota bacterium]